MTQEEIFKQYLKIERMQTKWELAEKKLQDSCTHPNVDVKFGSNTGNYDPSADYYWKDYHCPDCAKRWSVEQ